MVESRAGAVFFILWSRRRAKSGRLRQPAVRYICHITGEAIKIWRIVRGMPASRLDAGCTLWFMEREGDLIRLATMNEEFKEKLDIINCLCNETFSISVALFDKWLKLTRNNWSTTEFGINLAFGVLAIFFYLVWRFRIEICSCVKILRKILISSYHVLERVEGVICYLFTY